MYIFNAVASIPCCKYRFIYRLKYAQGFFLCFTLVIINTKLFVVCVKHKVGQALSFYGIAVDVENFSHWFTVIAFEYAVCFQLAQKFRHLLSFRRKVESIGREGEESLWLSDRCFDRSPYIFFVLFVFYSYFEIIRISTRIVLFCSLL